MCYLIYINGPSFSFLIGYLMKNRNIEDIIIPEKVTDGAGVSLNRTLGTNRIEHLDPFLLY